MDFIINIIGEIFDKIEKSKNNRNNKNSTIESEKSTQLNEADSNKNNKNRRFRVLKTVIVVIFVISTIINSLFTFKTNQFAVVSRFGKPIRVENKASLYLKFPFVDKVRKITKETRSLPFGYNVTIDGEVVTNEDSRMITGDENIVEFDLELQYRVVDPIKALYKVSNVYETLKNALSASVRSVVGSETIDAVLTDKKSEVDAAIEENLINILKEYDIGIEVVGINLQDADLPDGEVSNAFKEVTSAREERITKINGAEEYKNNEINIAKGKVESLINKAESYKVERINKAYGDVAIFNALYEQYRHNQKVTVDRLQLEAIKNTLPRMKLFITDSKGSTVNYLPLIQPQPVNQEDKPKEKQ